MGPTISKLIEGSKLPFGWLGFYYKGSNHAFVLGFSCKARWGHWPTQV